MWLGPLAASQAPPSCLALCLALAFVPGALFLVLTIVGIPLIMVLAAGFVAAWMMGYRRSLCSSVGASPARGGSG